MRVQTMIVTPKGSADWKDWTKWTSGLGTILGLFRGRWTCTSWGSEGRRNETQQEKEQVTHGPEAQPRQPVVLEEDSCGGSQRAAAQVASTRAQRQKRSPAVLDGIFHSINFKMIQREDGKRCHLSYSRMRSFCSFLRNIWNTL